MLLLVARATLALNVSLSILVYDSLSILLSRSRERSAIAPLLAQHVLPSKKGLVPQASGACTKHFCALVSLQETENNRLVGVMTINTNQQILPIVNQSCWSIPIYAT